MTAPVTDPSSGESGSPERRGGGAAARAPFGPLERLRFLADAGNLLAQSLDYETTLRNIARMAVPTFADWAVVDLVAGQDVRRIAIEHVDPALRDDVEKLRERYPEPADADYGVNRVLRTGEPEMAAVTPELLAKAAHDDEHRRILEALKLRSYIIVPMRARGTTHGALTFVLADTDEEYDQADLDLACELGTRAAIAIDNASLVTELQVTQEHLENSSTELEAQTEELQSMVEELEATTQDLAAANEQLTRARDEAEEARRAAEDANAAKSQFLATMSHELRTPLNAIDGYAELLELGIHGPVTEPQRQSLQRLRRAQKRLLALINDVLDFARLEAGQLTLEPRDITAAQLIAAVEPMLAPQLAAREQILVIEPIDHGLHAFADPQKTEQILINLIGNASKFSEPGTHVTITADRTGAFCRFRVADTGGGIPPDRLEAIFEPFVQVQGGLVRDHGGVGLGLSISRDLARSMNGELTVESHVGQGSVFTLLLPAGRAAPR